MLRSGYVHKSKCDGYNATYYDQTKRYFKVKIYEHFSAFPILLAKR